MPAPQAAATNYGSYLAGRVAHIRHDLNTAADYYMAAVADTPDNQMLPNQLYIILTSQGRIDEAIKYAKIALRKKATTVRLSTPSKPSIWLKQTVSASGRNHIQM